jgi:hypothetical protein
MGFPLRSSLLLLALASFPAAAEAKDDAQLWTGGSVTAKLGGSWRMSQELVARLSDRRGGLYEIESNTLLGYRLSPRLTLWAGYTHDPLYDGGHFTVLEQRAREQLTFDQVKAGPGTLSLRLRIEQRWREGVAGASWRLRPYARYSLPLGRGGSALILSHESFVNINRTAFQIRTGEERMRNAVAVTVPVDKRLNAEIGYLNQRGFVRAGSDTSDHVATIMLNVSF